MTTPDSAAIPVIMDVDTGIDDAFALLYAARSPRIDLLGVSCVDGNTTVDNVVSNTLTVLDAAGATDVPVARGAQRPLLADPCYADLFHGRDGLGDLGLSRSTRDPDPRHAVAFLRETILGSPRPVVLIATGPLTNLALLVRTHPEVRENLARIVVMAGAIGPGNATALAEFNAWHDPEAAAIVFGFDVPLTMYGLDVFRDVVLTLGQCEALERSAAPGAGLAARLARFDTSGAGASARAEDGDYAASGVVAGADADTDSGPSAGAGAGADRDSDAGAGLDADSAQATGNGFGATAAEPFVTCLGDYGAVAVAADPSHCTIEHRSVLVLTSAGVGRGQTVVDRRPPGTVAEGDAGLAGGRKIDVVTAIDAAHYADHWVRTLIQV